MLGSYTEQGVRNIKNIAQLREAAEQWTSAHNGRVVSNYTTLGPYDFVFTVELPNDEAVLEGAFTFGSAVTLAHATCQMGPWHARRPAEPPRDWGRTMTELLERAFAEAAKLPSGEQDALARWILDELAAEQRWDEAFCESADALARLADQALAEHGQGRTRVLDPDSL